MEKEIINILPQNPFTFFESDLFPSSLSKPAKLQHLIRGYNDRPLKGWIYEQNKWFRVGI